MSWHFIALQDRRALAYRYVDRQAGPSAKGVVLSGAQPTTAELQQAATAPNVTVRLGPGVQLSPLSAGDVQRLGLPVEPEWMRFFKAAAGPWTKDPRLVSKLHPDFPDDLQAAFFFAKTGRVEQMWVRLERAEPGLDAYAGRLLNTAHSDPSVAAGMPVLIRPAPGAPMPIWLSPDVLENLRGWSARCGDCGFDLVVEPVATLIARSFPDAPAGAQFDGFTTRCAMCTGTQVLQRR